MEVVLVEVEHLIIWIIARTSVVVRWKILPHNSKHSSSKAYHYVRGAVVTSFPFWRVTFKMVWIVVLVLYYYACMRACWRSTYNPVHVMHLPDHGNGQRRKWCTYGRCIRKQFYRRTCSLLIHPPPWISGWGHPPPQRIDSTSVRRLESVQISP